MFDKNEQIRTLKKEIPLLKFLKKEEVFCLYNKFSEDLFKAHWRGVEEESIQKFKKWLFLSPFDSLLETKTRKQF